MTDKKPATPSRTPHAERSRRTRGTVESRPSFGPLPKRPIPAASIAKAQKVFKKFSLSKFTENSKPHNYINVGEKPAIVQTRLIKQHIDKLANQDTSNRAMTVALSNATIKQSLPSLDQKAGTVDLDELMAIVEQKTRGTEFFTNGNPTLNRLSTQSHVQQIIKNVTGVGKKVKRGRK